MEAASKFQWQEFHSIAIHDSNMTSLGKVEENNLVVYSYVTGGVLFSTRSTLLAIHWFSWNVVLALTLLLASHRHPWRRLNSYPFGLAKPVVAFSLAFLLLSSLATRHPVFPPPNIDNLLVV
jgi:hypothetical protein